MHRFVMKSIFYVNCKFVQLNMVSGAVIASRDAFIQLRSSVCVVYLNECHESQFDICQHTCKVHVHQCGGLRMDVRMFEFCVD